MTMTGSFRIGRVAGIDLRIHYTWLFALVLVSVLIHELSHSLVALKRGLEVPSADRKTRPPSKGKPGTSVVLSESR